MMATWDDFDESESDEESSDQEIENSGLMGHIKMLDIIEEERAIVCPLTFNNKSVMKNLCLMAQKDHGFKNRTGLDRPVFNRGPMPSPVQFS
jgi:hypothetical protein